jgi:hypothetical protein
VFIRGTNSKQREVPKIAGRNTKANIFQNGSAGFKAIIDLKKESDQPYVPFRVKKVYLISLRQKYNYMERGKNNKNRRTQTSAGCAQAC